MWTRNNLQVLAAVAVVPLSLLVVSFAVPSAAGAVFAAAIVAVAVVALVRVLSGTASEVTDPALESASTWASANALAVTILLGVILESAGARLDVSWTRLAVVAAATHAASVSIARRRGMELPWRRRQVPRKLADRRQDVGSGVGDR